MNEQNQNGECKNTRAEKVGYKIGAFFAYVVAGCAVAILLALTAKFVGWILL